MAGFNDLFSDPMAALGYGLLTNAQNPIQAGVQMWGQAEKGKQSAADAKLDRELKQQLLQVQIQKAMMPKRTVTHDARGNPILVDKATGMYDNALPSGVNPGGLDDGGIPITDPATQANIDKVNNQVAVDDFKNLNKIAAGARSRLNLLGQAEGALQGLDTGPTAGARALGSQIPLVGELFGGEGFATGFQAAEAATNPIAKTFRVAGEGSSSDRDVSILQKSAPSTKNTPEANRLIIAAQRAQAERDIDYATTLQGLFNRGVPAAQAKKAYGEYTEANPIFGGNSIDSGLNKNRIKTFDEWVAAGSPKKTQQQPTQGGGQMSQQHDLSKLDAAIARKLGQ